MPRFTFNNDGLWARPVRLGRSAATWLGARLLNLVYPPRCIHCDVELPPDDDRRSLCSSCCQVLGPETWSGCRRCGARVGNGVVTQDHCPNCDDFQLHFDTVSPLGAYDGELRQVVLKMKRISHEPLSVAMGQLLALRRGAQFAEFRPSMIVPIPMHWRRRLWRGVNSPEILAQSLSHRLRVPAIRGALVRCRHTVPQRDLLPRERFQNVRDAFLLRHPDSVRWKDSHVLLVDDILTTGATCSEAARAFKKAGAAAVAVAVVAKAQGMQDL